MEFWSGIEEVLERGQNICLLHVIESEGSSPGRQRFKMFVTQEGIMKGTIGGGFMEQKLVELSKSLLKKGEMSPFIKRQIHQKDVGKDKSGMICSGEQTVAFYFLSNSDLPLINEIAKTQKGILKLDNSGMFFSANELLSIPAQCEITNEEMWTYQEQLNYRDTVYIVGGGHVSIALSQTMNQLGFKVIVLDDRDNLNTMEQNTFAHEKHLINYVEADKHIPEGDNVYVVLVSFGFKTDEVVLRKIIRNKYKYLGMMGSKEKVKELFKNMKDDGFSQKEIDSVYSPIGIQIHSKTTPEIAVSIAAEIIQVKHGQN